MLVRSTCILSLTMHSVRHDENTSLAGGAYAFSPPPARVGRSGRRPCFVRSNELAELEVKTYRWLRALSACVILLFGLQSCSEKSDRSEEQAVRGLRAYKVSASAESRVRRFPSVQIG